MDSTPNSTPTVTQHQQCIVEFEVFNIYRDFFDLLPAAKDGRLRINRDRHIEFLTSGLQHLEPSFSALDANRPWLCYWILHSLALLRESVDDDLENNAIDFLNRCQDPDGGYGGGPRQLPHLATTYAAVNALITLGGEKALSTINRGKLYSFLLRMKDQSGGFRMHDGGEIDVRASYTAISVASVLNILDNELVQNVGDYILSCQTYEGGIAGEPGSEAHGGYSFCGLATMILINEVHRLDLIGLMNWVAFRQGIEGGFQGRTNKLVDGCYSFWQGGALALIQRLPSIVSKQLTSSDFREETSVDSPQNDATSEGGRGLDRTSKVNDEHYGHEEALSNIGSNFLKLHSEGEPLFQIVALQQYLLLCSQEPRGGFKDKPGKSRDYYHTCYCLSGLSLCQYSGCRGAESPPLPSAVLGPYENLLEPVHPLYNVVLDRYHEAHEFFSG